MNATNEDKLTKEEVQNIEKSYGGIPKSDGHIVFLSGEEYFYAGEGINRHVRKAWIMNPIVKRNPYGNIRGGSKYLCNITAWKNGPLYGLTD